MRYEHSRCRPRSKREKRQDRLKAVSKPPPGNELVHSLIGVPSSTEMQQTSCLLATERASSAWPDVSLEAFNFTESCRGEPWPRVKAQAETRYGGLAWSIGVKGPGDVKPRGATMTTGRTLSPLNGHRLTLLSVVRRVAADCRAVGEAYGGGEPPMDGHRRSIFVSTSGYLWWLLLLLSFPFLWGLREFLDETRQFCAVVRSILDRNAARSYLLYCKPPLQPVEWYSAVQYCTVQYSVRTPSLDPASLPPHTVYRHRHAASQPLAKAFCSFTSTAPMFVAYHDPAVHDIRISSRPSPPSCLVHLSTLGRTVRCFSWSRYRPWIVPSRYPCPPCPPCPRLPSREDCTVQDRTVQDEDSTLAGETSV
jgi:hypothetical protein